MKYIIIIVILFIIYFLIKGNADMKNVNKYGGLKNKYKTIIDLILARNPFYNMREINPNNIELSSTGVRFKLIELDKKLQVTWFWSSLQTGKNYKLIWKFDETENQHNMYAKIKNDIDIHSLMDEGLTKTQATDIVEINNTTDKEKQERLINIFNTKYPDL